MGDQSSESGGDSWVFVNENHNISLEEDKTQPLNLELNYDSVCSAASDSIKSSLSSEELEWQYEYLESNIDLLPYSSPHVENLHVSDSQNGHVESCNLDQTEDTDLSSPSINYEEEADIDIASVHKTYSYKHNRNEHLNFILNIILALTVSSALGLGTGHFLGWSHKCWRNMPYFKEANNHILSDDSFSDQNMPDVPSVEKEIKSSLTVLQDIIPESFDLPTKMERGFIHHDTCKETSRNSVINSITAKIIQNSVSSNSDILEFSVSNVVNQNNFSDLEHPVASKINHYSSGLAQITLPVKSLNEQLSHFSDKTALEKDGSTNSRNNEIYLQSKIFNDYKNKNSNKGTNFTSELRNDLIHVAQTLNAIALTHISSGKKMPVEDLTLITKLYKDLERIINTKISYIDDFIQSDDNKNYPKFGLKYTQKMVYSLIDTFDYVMKMNMKTFSKDYKQLNFFKFSKNMSKIVLNFDKKWEKNLESWSERIKNIKDQEYGNFYKSAFKREKKNWKEKVPFNTASNKINKYKGHSVKY